MRHFQTVEKRLKCPVCGNVQSIHRRKGRNRGKGHIKDLYCPGCRQTTKHVELGNPEELLG